MCESWFCGPLKDFISQYQSDQEHAVKLACSLLIPPRLFLALWTPSIFLVKGHNNKSSGVLVFQAWWVLLCGPFTERLWTLVSCSFLRSWISSTSCKPHEGWRAPVALLCPTMHTSVFYIPLEFSGWQRAIQSGRFWLCFYLAKCTKCTSPGSRSSTGFILMWIQATVLSRACSIVLWCKTLIMALL